MNVNLGSGLRPLPDWINVDALELPGVDIVWNLNTFPWPFKDGSIDRMQMDNVLEHLDDVVKVMEEIYRILVDGGTIEIKVPYYKTKTAFKDPTHRHFFTEDSITYFTPENPCHFYTTAKFKLLSCKKYRQTGFPIYHIKRYLKIDIKPPIFASEIYWKLQKM